MSQSVTPSKPEEAKMEIANEVEPTTNDEKLPAVADGTKGRRSSAGRPKISRIMKDVQEGEALLKEMGHAVDGADEGKRRTRSSTRGGPPPPPTPPPVKRQRRSGSTSANNSAEKPKKVTPVTVTKKGHAKGRGRGRPKREGADKTDNLSDEEKMEPENSKSDECVDTKNDSNIDAEEDEKKIEKAEAISSEIKVAEKETTPKRMSSEKNSNDSGPEKQVEASKDKGAVEENKVEVTKIEDKKSVLPEKKDTTESRKPETQGVTSSISLLDKSPLKEKELGGKPISSADPTPAKGVETEIPKAPVAAPATESPKTNSNAAEPLATNDAKQV